MLNTHDFGHDYIYHKLILEMMIQKRIKHMFIVTDYIKIKKSDYLKTVIKSSGKGANINGVLV